MSSDIDTDAGHFGRQEPGAEDRAAEEPGAEEPGAEVDGDDGRHMGHLDEGHTHGPTEGQYFTIFWVLFGITALEVSTYFWEDWFGDSDAVRQFGVAVLLTLMVIKFVMIAGYFMHLRFDAPLLRRTFIFGLVVALAVYTVALTVMNIWTDNGNPWIDAPPPEVTTTTVAEGG